MQTEITLTMWLPGMFYGTVEIASELTLTKMWITLKV